MKQSALVAAVVLALAFATPAHAEERPERLMGLHRREGWLGISVSLRDLFGPRERERLHSGFVNRVVINVALVREGVREGESRVIARQARAAHILYDLWDERFQVKLEERGGETAHQVATVAEAIELGTTLQAFPLAELNALDPRATYRVRLRADLNPLSEELVKDVRRWLVRTPGQGRTATGDSVFGSFVSFFVNPRIEESERQITLWSQPITQGGER